MTIAAEVSFDGFKDVLDIVNPAQDSIFFDCGSGIGKAMVIASLLYPFKKLVGVEELPSLANSSKELLNQFCSQMLKKYPGVSIPAIEVLQDSFVNVELASADVIFAHSSCYDETLMNSLKSNVEMLKNDAYIITLTKQLIHPQLECIHKGFHKMGWGSPTVFIYKKNS